MVAICRHCKKYIFDEQNVNSYKRMTTQEYINGVYRKTIKTNDPWKTIASELGIIHNGFVNKSDCELCGAPHAIISFEDEKVYGITFFYSGRNKPSETDVQFINHFRRDFFSR